MVNGAVPRQDILWETWRCRRMESYVGNIFCCVTTTLALRCVRRQHRADNVPPTANTAWHAGWWLVVLRYGKFGKIDMMEFPAILLVCFINVTSLKMAHLQQPGCSRGSVLATLLQRTNERKIYACRSAACIKERVSHRLPPIEGIFISTPASRNRSVIRYCNAYLDSCFYEERLRLLGGPSLRFTLHIPGRLALVVEQSPGGVWRVSLSSGLTFWVEGRTLACMGVWIECIGEAVHDLCLEHVRLLGGSLWGWALGWGRGGVGTLLNPGVSACTIRPWPGPVAKLPVAPSYWVNHLPTKPNPLLLLLPPLHTALYAAHDPDSFS
eukprot:1152197-Pelagomonas_calceolata.AAC.2